MIGDAGTPAEKTRLALDVEDAASEMLAGVARCMVACRKCQALCRRAESETGNAGSMPFADLDAEMKAALERLFEESQELALYANGLSWRLARPPSGRGVDGGG